MSQSPIEESQGKGDYLRSKAKHEETLSRAIWVNFKDEILIRREDMKYPYISSFGILVILFNYGIINYVKVFQD